ncbi:MAG: trypsin-like peptidase domain-containing protein [Byssovorax sp.]
MPRPDRNEHPMANLDSEPPPPKAGKPAAKADKADKPAPRPAPSRSAPPSAQWMAFYRLLKLLAFVLALPAALLGVMALVGSFTDNGYARVGVALVVTFGLPLFIADRLLPDHDPTAARGLVTDVLTVSWAIVGFVIAGAAHGATKPMLINEGDRLVKQGYVDFARGAYLLAGVSATIPGAATGEPDPAASGSAGAAASASAAPSDAGPASDAGDLAEAGAPPDAGKTTGLRGEKTPAEIFKELAPSVVTIFSKHGPMGDGGGTGFVVDRSGIVATNHHVIDHANAVRIKFQNGATYEDVDLLFDEQAADLALLQVNLSAPLEGGTKPDAVPLNLGDSDAIVVGEHAVSIGNPLGLEHTLSDGLISSRRIYDNKAWIQFSAPISPGNSGGPLFNMRGEVIGVTTATILGHGIAQNLNLAVPVNELKKLFRPAYPGRRKFGDGSAPSQW